MNKQRRAAIVVIAIAMIAMLFLSACHQGKDPVSLVPATPSPASAPVETPRPLTPTGRPESIPAIEETENDSFLHIDLIIDEAIAIIDGARQDDRSTASFGFEKELVYDVLNEEDRALYDEIIPKVRAFEPFTYTADAYGYDVLDGVMRVCGAIALDWPEFENSFMIGEVMEGDRTVALTSRYFMPWDAAQEDADQAELREQASLFDAIAERIVERMPKELSTYDKYRYLAAMISLVTEYDHTCEGGWQDGTAYGAIVGGYSICQGYSRGFMTLCEKANLWCVCVEGAVDNVSHMWNMVRLDTGIYHVDVTWADELGAPDSAEWPQYFMRTEDEISADHTIAGETIKIYEKEYQL